MAGPLVSLELNVREWEAMLRAGQNGYRKAAARSINKALAKRRTLAVRKVAAEAKIQPQKLVRRRVKLKGAKQSRLVARLGFVYRPIRVSSLRGARDTGSGGWSTRKGKGVRAYGGRHYPNAWLATGIGGYLVAIERKGKERYKTRGLKVEIQQFVRPAVKEAVNEAAKLVAKELPKQLMAIMDQRRK